MRFAVMNPHMRAGYSGPTIFMKRLFGQIASDASVEVTAVGPQLPNVRSEKISYAKLNTPDLRNASGQAVWACKSFFWLVKNHRSYDFVHFHGGYIFNLMGAIAPLFLRKPFVVLPLGAGGDLRIDARSNRLPFIRSLKKFLLKRARRTFALSDDNASELRAWGVPQTRITHINNPASDDYFSAPKLNARYSHDILLVGKLGTGKRPDLVIEALDKLIKAGWHDATLTLVGPFESYDFEEKIHSIIDRYRLRKAVYCTGYVSNAADVLKRLPNAIFVLPSLQEGLPGALTESMAMGMPAVVTDVGSMGDVVRESSCGYVVEPSATEISNVIQQIWNDHSDWLRLATAAHNYAKIHFSEKAVAQKYVTSLGLGEVSEA